MFSFIKKTNSQKGGLIRIVLIIIAIILVLSYFNVNIENFLKSPSVKANFGFVTDKILYVWQNFLQKPVRAAFHFFIYYIWDPAVEGLERMRNGGSAFDLEGHTPKVTPP